MERKLLVDPALVWDVQRVLPGGYDSRDVVSRFVALSSGVDVTVPEFRSYKQSAYNNDNLSRWKVWDMNGRQNRDPDFYLTHDTQSMDYKLSRAQAHRGNINRRALDGATRYTKNNASKYFNKELIDNENQIWWESDDQVENDYLPY